MKPLKKMDGLGDLVEEVAQKTGVKWVVDKVSEKTSKHCRSGKISATWNCSGPLENSF